MLERHIVLSTIDEQWQEYLRGVDALRQSVGLRAYGQRDPLVEYKREAFEMFEKLMTNIKNDIASAVFKSTTSVESYDAFLEALPKTLVHDEVSMFEAAAMAQNGDEMPSEALPPARDMSVTVSREEPKTGRNDPCPCGSGKKFKKCCGV